MGVFRELEYVMNKYYLYFVCWLGGLAGVFLSSSTLLAAEDNRMVLALYDNNDSNVYETNVHLLLEMPLNRLGMVVEYHSINDLDYPDAGRYRAVVVWLNSDVSEFGHEYYNFLQQALDKGVRVILMNGAGIVENKTGMVYEQEEEALLRRLGVVQGDIGYLKNPFSVKYHHLREDAFGFEISAAEEVSVYRDYRAVAGEITPWMEVVRTDVPDSTAMVVGVGAKGAFVADSEMVARYITNPVWGILWDLNPFVFLEEALGLEKGLRPDVTTFFGLRGAFSEVDGDGSANMTVDVTPKAVPCTRVLLREILQRYKFPITASVIGYRLTEEGSGGEEFVTALRDILSLPHIQAASHTYTHPMIWSKGITEFKIPGYSFDPVMETVGSIEMIREVLLPKGKDIEMLLWSGDCQATSEALAALESAGFQNMNGGNARYDELYRGICHICPLSIEVGEYRQYYAPAGNEYLYTKSWTENFGGLAQVIATFENTRVPRYLPVDVYYHYYVAERQAGLNSLFKIYDWCQTQELCWIHTAEYTRAVAGFVAAKTGRDGAGRYYITDYGGLNTVRLDAETRGVDMKQSRNVLGYTHFAGSLYVTLQPGKRAEIVLTPEEGMGLYVGKSTDKLRGVELNGKSIHGMVRVYAPGYIEFGGVEQGVVLEIGEKRVKPVPGNSLRFPLPSGTGEWLEFAVEVEARESVSRGMGASSTEE